LFKYFGSDGQNSFNFYKETERDRLLNEVSKNMTREEIDKELRHARAIFMKYDTDGSGQLGPSEVRPMLVDTYKALNSNFEPKPQDIQAYINMMDEDGSGEVSLNEYEIFILKALKKRNMNM
jgi:Ca2+-binding EF-hand superfamily protein